MKTLTTDTPGHNPVHDSELYDWLKTAEPAAPTVVKKAQAAAPMDKEGEDPGETLEDNEDGTEGINPVQVPDPETTGEGTIDASWGQEDGKNDAIHFSNEATKQFRQNREVILGRLLDGKASSEGAEQALLGQNLSHAASGQFETSSPMLTDKSKLQKTGSAKTLLERVRATLGRY